MPRRSSRQAGLRKLKAVVDARRDAAALRYLLDEENSSDDDLDMHHAAAYESVLGSRYFARPSVYRRREDQWKRSLYDTEHLNATEFLEHFRMERGAFFRLVDLVQQHPVLVSLSSRKDLQHRTQRSC
jgi:hypothetical protein